MPKPAALFAATDDFAARANAFCRAEGIRVPDDVAILGCDNDPASCIPNHPSRSSVDLAPFAIGWRAAETLHGMMLGNPPPGAPVRVPPGPVVTRQSTDILAVEDPLVARAVAFLHANLGEPLQVTDLARAAGLSRRPMEARFRKHPGQTPLEVIKTARLAKARALIAAGDLPMAEISRRTGFASSEQFAKAFKQMHGITPSQYRQHSGPPKAPAVQAVEPR